METTRKEFLMAGAFSVGGLGFVRAASAEEKDSKASKPITQLAEFQLNMDKEEEAVEALKALCAAVEATEPGTLAYVCTRSKKKPERIVFFEIFKNAEALEAHGKTPHLAAFGSSFGTLFQPPVKITVLDRVGGFMR